MGAGVGLGFTYMCRSSLSSLFMEDYKSYKIKFPLASQNIIIHENSDTLKSSFIVLKVFKIFDKPAIFCDGLLFSHSVVSHSLRPHGL